MMANKYSQREIEFIIDNHSILTDQEIARHLGRTVKGIETRRREMKLNKRHRKDKVSKARTLNVELRALVLFLNTGKLPEQTKARIMEISNNHRLLKHRLPRKRKLQPKYGVICELYSQGLTLQEIGNRIGMHKGSGVRS
jgi:DNA-binding CsgD family transcriptional regulator